MASGSFDYSSDPRFQKVRRSAQFGLYDQDALSQALQNPDLMGIEGYDPMAALQSVGDVGRMGDPSQYFDEYTTGLTSAIAADPSARDPGFQGMSFTDFQRLFPERAKSYVRSDAYQAAMNTPSPANPAAVSSPGTTGATGDSGSTWGAEDRQRAIDDQRRKDQEELDRRRRDDEERRRREDQRRRDDEERRRREDEDRERQRQEDERRRREDEARIREEERARLAEGSRGTASGPEAQPEVDVRGARPAAVHQAEGPSTVASTVAGGLTDEELRQQQMDTQREAVASAEEAGAETVRGLPAMQVADPNLDIQLAAAEAPSGGPDMLATGDVEYDPEYFQYETDLGNVYLDALRQSLGGEGGMDPQTAAQMADLEAKQAKDEAQTVEDLQRYGVLRGGGDTADVLGELRSGYGRTYSDILGDQAYRQMNDPRYQAALDLADLKSGRYMEGGQMIGRLGGQDTLEARLAQQEAIEREADISGFLRGARSLEGREQDIDAQFGRADRQLEQARVLAPQYERAADLSREDALLQQDVADRSLVRGLTITEPTKRESFEEGVRRAQVAEGLAEAGVTGRFEGEDTLERDRMEEETKRLNSELANQVKLGNIDLDKATQLQELINSGNLDLVTQELESAERMQTEALTEEGKRLTQELDSIQAVARIEAKSEADIQNLINTGDYNKAQMLINVEKEMQGQELSYEQENLIKELKNAITLGQIDSFGAQDLQKEINAGNIEIAKQKLEETRLVTEAQVDVAKEERGSEKELAELEGKRLTEELERTEALARIEAKSRADIQNLINEGEFEKAEMLINVEKEMQGQSLSYEQENLIKELKNAITLGQIDSFGAQDLQKEINAGNLAVVKEELEAAKEMQTERVGMEERESQRRERQLKWTLANAVELGHIGSGQAQRIQELINEGQLDLATEETTQLGLTLASEEAMQTERVTASSADLAAQLENNIALGNIDMNKAVEIQTLINSGELELAQKELEGITATLASEEAMQTERVGMEERESQRRERQLKMTLDNAVELGHISSGQAQRVQELINEGQLDLATEETTQLGLTLASEEAMQTERVGMEERESQRRERQLKMTLDNAVELGHISSGQAQRVQELINEGQLDLATEETTQLGLTLASEEAMQTERIESEEGMFANEMEFQRAIATGEIDGMPTLDAMVTKAELANMLSARQAEGIGQMLALANAIPNEETRAKVMASIARPLQGYMETGGGYTELKLAFKDLLNVDPEEYGL